jgi:glycerol-3-phosphate dehydrogenase
MAVSVAVVGAGRMGAVVAAQLPAATRKIIIDTDIITARRVATGVGGQAHDRLDAAAAADLVALVLPAPAIASAIRRLAAFAKRDCIILNMATSAQIDPLLREQHGRVHIIDARIIGHAVSMAAGEPAMVVVACADESLFFRIRRQLPGFRQVVQGDADLVEPINRVCTEAGLRAALAAKAQLAAMQIPDDWIAIALRTVSAGVIKAYVDDDLGPFALDLAGQLANPVAQP